MDPGDIRNLFRGFFGFPNHRHPNENYNRSDRFGVPPNGHSYHDDDDGDGDWLDAEEHNREVLDGNPRGFYVYTDPLEICVPRPPAKCVFTVWPKVCTAGPPPYTLWAKL